MKKTALIILLTAMTALTGFSQSAYDAWRFSQNEYEGTARSAAMGNAFTALGGDLGSISINPAGSAVAGYSQFTITPGLSISSATSKGVAPYPGADLTYFGKEYSSSKTTFGFPNIGMTLHVDTGRTSGLKSFTVGFVANRTMNWCENVYAKGTNSTTSFAGAAAYDASANMADYNLPGNLPMGEPRYSYKDLIADNAYDYYFPWKDIVAYRSNMIATIDNEGEQFIGATEILLGDGNIQQGGPLMQTYGRNIDGYKTDYIFNIGANISDFVYLGFNLGFNSISYNESMYFNEEAIDEADFENIYSDADGNEEIAYFKNLSYKHSYSANGSGVYGKFGIIVTPGYGLRIGAAIQTPTAMYIDEQWRESASTNFSKSTFSNSESSPLGEYSYSFTSPFRANFGIAYTFGSIGLISADYEVVDYSSMKYSIDWNNMSNSDIDYFEMLNEEILYNYTAGHMFRLGAEFKPHSTLAIRAGYNFASQAQTSHNLSFGMGYISKGSFFTDIACRYNFAADEYYMPYSNYLYNETGNAYNYSPELLIRNSTWKVLLTLGWRF